MARGVILWAVSIALLCSAAAVTANAAHQAAAAQATKAAAAWLRLVDEGRYRESWEETSSLFRSAVSEKEWEQKVGAVRKPLGRVVSRKLKLARYATSLPGAPDGQYVVIQYATSFANKKSAVETVTPMLDTEGRWRVSGYYIK